MKNMTTVLLSGYYQTGNTWVGLLLCNYFNILNFNATESLLKIDVIHILEHNIKKEIEAHFPLNFKDGFPSVYQTHNSKFKTPEKTKFFNQFDKFVYLYRNPYDTMISLFYNQVVKKNKSLWKLYLIKNLFLSDYDIFVDFVNKKLQSYINHVKKNKPYADLVLNYDDLRKNTIGFRKLLELLVDEINEDIFTKALKMSSFENTRKMETKKKQKENELIFFKTRNGKSGQYKEVMNLKLIDFITKKWEDAKLNE